MPENLFQPLNYSVLISSKNPKQFNDSIILKHNSKKWFYDLKKPQPKPTPPKPLKKWKEEGEKIIYFLN